LSQTFPQTLLPAPLCWTGTEFLGFDGVRWFPLNGIEASPSTVPIKIWSYLFQFPRAFSLVPGDGTDTYIGTIEGTGISLDFEHTLSNGAFIIDTPSDGYTTTSSEVDGHSILISRPNDAYFDVTKIIIYRWIDETDSPDDYSLFTLSVSNITRAQQEMLIEVFNTVEVVEPSVPIEIGRYRFQFPIGFSLVPEQGFDSYVGQINGAGISLSFDYGAYTGPASGLSPSEYVVTEDEIEGNFRQIVKPVDSENNITRIHMYNIDSKLDDPYFYSSLTISVKNITLAEQQMIIDVFNAVEIVY